MAKITVQINNQQSALPIDRRQLRQAVKNVLEGEGISGAEISIAVVDDPMIHALNRQYLAHDYATDVLSFVLEESEDCLEGEIVISAETAQRQAAEYGWPANSELLLYLIHGTLHLTGYDDHSEEDRGEMRRLERKYLGLLGITPPQE